MNKFPMILTTILAISILAACNNESEKNVETPVPPTEQQIPVPTPVATLPDFNILDRNGKTVNLSSLKGKKVFVNLWATWCPPCRHEIPSIESLYTKTSREKVEFVMLSLDNDFETAKSFAKKNKMDAPVYYPAASLPALFDVPAIPTTFIFDEKGELVKTITGSDDYDTEQYVEMLK